MICMHSYSTGRRQVVGQQGRWPGRQTGEIPFNAMLLQAMLNPSHQRQYLVPRVRAVLVSAFVQWHPQWIDVD